MWVRLLIRAKACARWALALAAIVFGVFGLSAGSAAGGTIEVNTTADQRGEDSAHCALREAIIAANTDDDFGGCAGSGGSDRLKLGERRYVLTRSGDGEDAARKGDLDITDDLQIQGAGKSKTVIDGNGGQIGDRVFDIQEAGKVSFSKVTIEDGNSPTFSGGAISSFQTELTIRESAIADSFATGGGGGILSSGGSLTVEQSTVEGNETGLGTAGGGIFVQSTDDARIDGSTIAGNRANSFGGGIASNTADLVINGSTVRGNRAGGDVGGVSLTGGTLVATKSLIEKNIAADQAGGVSGFVAAITLTDTTVSKNRAQAAGGGGIHIVGSSAQLLLKRSTVSENRAATDGGGVLVESGTGQLLNSTVSANSAGDNGGGIQAGATSGDTETTLNNVTIAANRADSDSNGGSGGGVFRASGGLVAYNSILGDNLAGPSGEPDCGGAIAAFYSLIEDNCDGLGSNNIVGEDPLMGPLADNGGLTATHALQGGSPAVNAADPAAPGSTDSACLTTDQRRLPRPGGNTCDMGAFERQPG